MPDSTIDIPARLREAVAHYWKTRGSQGDKQGVKGIKDAGQRSSVTGGKQLDGFARLLCDLLVAEGIDRKNIFYEGRGFHTIPGFYRPTKDWDLLVIADGQLWIAVELKSQVGPSFGNNYNNRVEEGLGNAADIRTAYSKQTFGTVSPFVGYFLLLEDCVGCHGPVRTSENHFPIRPEFRDASYVAVAKPMSLSYAQRYEMFCRKVVQESVYDAAAFMLASKGNAQTGIYTEPAADLAFTKLAAAMLGKAHEYLMVKKLEG
jgi:hypothetical protein